MSLRAIVALVGASTIGVGLLIGNYTMVVVVLVAYVIWMFIRDWLGRREKYSGWTDVTRRD
jgi:hypothetical protein